MPITDAAAVVLPGNTPFQVKQTTQYLDGMGRPLQTVSKQQSPGLLDMVETFYFDSAGKQSLKYLPYISPTPGGNFKSSPWTEQEAFMNNLYNAGNNGDRVFYSKTDYEPSPLNRTKATYAPGNSWAGSGTGIREQYMTNNIGDSVIIWNIGYTNGSVPASGGYYPAGKLFRNTVKDENGNQEIEYKNGEGQVLLKKSQLSASPSSGHTGWLCTYSVYDDFGHLRYVIQPKGVEWLKVNNWTFDGTTWRSSMIARELTFSYEYDSESRVIIKRTAGAGEVWMVYDAIGRPVFMQDSSLRSQGKWFGTLFDALNRPVILGLLTYAGTLAGFQQQVTSQSGSGVMSSTLYNSMLITDNPLPAGAPFELLKITYYDSYSWISSGGSGVSGGFNTTATGNTNYFYTPDNTHFPYPQAIVSTGRTWGKMTGSKVKILGTANTYLYNAVYYDDKGRVIQNQQTDITGGNSITTFQYDFGSRILRSLIQHTKGGVNPQTHTVVTKMQYDQAGRLTRVWKNIDNAGSDQPIDSLQYDELGKLHKKYLGNNIDSITYDYNIRGWTTGINRNYVGGGTGNYFGMELGYDKQTSIAGTTYATPQLNGNLAGMVWKTQGDTAKRKYDFTYDNTNRLTGAGFLQNANGAGWSSAVADFSVNNLTYDANGNILTMNQKGIKLNTSSLIDSLSYSYLANSNKLNKVNDAVNDTASKLGDFHYKGTKQNNDYIYDGNGNLTMDNNRSVSSIVYNFLNLPQLISIKGKGTIQYVYDATGNRLQKIVVDSTILPVKTTTMTYDGEFVYQQDTLQFISHEEGKARWAYHKYTSGSTGYKLEYDFFEKDNLGNVRMVLTQQKDTALYLATMEAAYRNTENALFYNLPQTSFAKAGVPGGYPADTTTVPNDSVSRVNGNGPKAGPAVILKVMAGDRFDLAVRSFYRSGGTSTNTNSDLNDILASLATGIFSLTGGAKGALPDLSNQSASPLLGALNAFNNANDITPSGKPKAYLNWMVLDNQFNAVASKAYVVGAADNLVALGETGINVTKNGYLYIWVSNETQNWDVFFDNLSIHHYSGPILEETHYYPFGLTMAGISDRALKANYPENKFRYNGKELQNHEFSDGSGLEEYDYGARMQDPQIGRFHVLDPHGNKYSNFSPYNYVFNNPENATDPTGMDTHLTGEAAQEFAAALANEQALNDNGWSLDEGIDNIDALAKKFVWANEGEGGDNFTTKSTSGAAPGDRLYYKSFNWKVGTENSFYSTWMEGLRFEDGTNKNEFNTYFYLANGIDDKNLNKVPKNDVFLQGETSLGYLQDFFPDLFKDNHITLKKENGGSFWYFDNYAAQTIAAQASNLGQIFVTQSGPYAFTAAIPGNRAAIDEFEEIANGILKSWMPGSSIGNTVPASGTTESFAIYNKAYYSR